MSLSTVSVQKSTIDRAGIFRSLTSGLSTVAPGLAAVAAEQLFVTVLRHKRPRREDAWAEAASRISIPSPHGELPAWVWGDGLLHSTGRVVQGRTFLSHQSRVGGMTIEIREA